ncbi:MAG: hypothetical protein KDD38_04800 [Bdellovibrionales bacterium]|nr:hypothetical protein [Bdellovibrionales bacterium]
MSRVLNALVLIVYFILPLPASAGKIDKDYVIPVSSKELKIMSYNVQNLFDATHDSGKNDYEFLPSKSPQKKNCPTKGRGSKACTGLDWTKEKVDLKIQQIVKAVAAQGSLPEILVLTEVENKGVVKQLSDALGYDDFVMTTSPDARGIDCAVLYKEDKLKPLDFFELTVADALYPTRNLSVMLFELDDNLGGGVFGVFPNHWPSQGNPTKARSVVANTLREFIDDVRSDYKKETFHYVVTGDFNTTEKDSPHPIDTVLLDPKWDASLINVRALAIKEKSPMISKMPPATYYYEPENAWNEFDRFFINPELNDRRGLEIDSHSYRIHAPDLVTKTSKNGNAVPFRYNHHSTSKNTLGYSDHFAVVVKFKNISAK